METKNGIPWNPFGNHRKARETKRENKSLRLPFFSLECFPNDNLIRDYVVSFEKDTTGKAVLCPVQLITRTL